jgi:hypothetical protein
MTHFKERWRVRETMEGSREGHIYMLETDHISV